MWVVLTLLLSSFHSPVTIFGTNLLGHASNISQVEFGNLEAVVDYDSISNTTIRVRVQANAVTVNTPVQVVITAVTMASVVSNGNEWTYLVPGRVVDVQPITGQFGTIVTITGKKMIVYCVCEHACVCYVTLLFKLQRC